MTVAHLNPDDPLVEWADRLAASPTDLVLSGHLTGSIDLVLRIEDEIGTNRFVVADYKTNALTMPSPSGPVGDYGLTRLAEAMASHDYPLQALLYLVALHRYLRWRLGAPSHVASGRCRLSLLRGMTGPSVTARQNPPASSAGPSRRLWWWPSVTCSKVGRWGSGHRDASDADHRRPVAVPASVALLTLLRGGGRSWDPSRCSSLRPWSVWSPPLRPRRCWRWPPQREPRFGHVFAELDRLPTTMAGDDDGPGSICCGRRTRTGSAHWSVPSLVLQTGGHRQPRPPSGVGRATALPPALLA